MVTIGNKGTLFKTDESNPTVLSDIFTRTCGPSRISSTSTDIFLEVNNSDVIGDNLWLWRADHTKDGKTTNSNCRCDNGVIVNGNDVTFYG